MHSPLPNYYIEPRQNLRTLKISSYVYMTLGLTIGLIILCFGLKAVGLAAAPRNPLSSFADVFPGQPVSAAQVRGFTCLLSAYGGTATPNQYCNLQQMEGAFSLVSVIVDGNMIREISFRLRDNSLNVGDLITLWGEPDIQEYSNSVYYYWREQGIFALANENSGQSSLFLQIRRVNISEVNNGLSNVP